MIGIIGYGFVGKAVAMGFSKTKHIASDPAYNNISIADVCNANPDAIFVCVPTPSDGTNYALLRSVLDELGTRKYEGIIAVKSTVLPDVIRQYDIVLNPEFLSRKTANDDFIHPPFVLLGGTRSKTDALAKLYEEYSIVDMTNVVHTDIATAAMVKYALNTFFATKITFMNQLYDVAQLNGVGYEQLKLILQLHPWMGQSHMDVPGWEGRGFAGPCLPKDTQAYVNQYGERAALLRTVIDINAVYTQR